MSSDIELFEPTDDFHKLAAQLDDVADRLLMVHKAYGLFPIRGFFLERAGNDIHRAASAIRKHAERSS